jgi:hypothetical protein
MNYIIESGCMVTVTDNGWSNNIMAINYIKHFNKYTEPIGDYRLLILLLLLLLFFNKCM